MEGTTRNKTYVVLLTGIIFLSLVRTIQPLKGTDISNTIIVDDDGTADYQIIEQTIEAAQNGDNIFVRSGVYQEQNLIIEKTLTLTGEERETTIVQGDGSETLCIIRANEVTISNFTFAGGGGEFIGSNLDISANDCIIFDNIIIDNEDVGITIHDSSNVVIKNNMISYCPFAAIRLYENTDSNTVKNNQIDECINGILVGNSVYQLIQYNMVSNCSKGIYLEECHENKVEYNQIFNNAQGVFVTYAADNLITKNNFISNREHAKFTTWLSPTGLQISKWNANYWDDAIASLPKWIPGVLFIRTYNPIGIFLPWGSIDWNPSNSPYPLE